MALNGQAAHYCAQIHCISQDYPSISYAMSYAPVGHGYNACTSVFQLIMDLIFKLTSAEIDKMIHVGMVVTACGEPQTLLPVQF